MNLSFLSRNRAILVGGALAAPLFAHAQAAAVDFSSLTAGVAFGGVVTAILAVGLVKVAPQVAIWGTKKILGMIGR